MSGIAASSSGNLNPKGNLNPEYHQRWILEAKQRVDGLALEIRVLDKLQANKVVGQATISYNALANMNLEPPTIIKIIFKMLDEGFTLTKAIDILVDTRAPWRKNAVGGKITREEATVDSIFNNLKKEVESGKLTKKSTKSAQPSS